MNPNRPRRRPSVALLLAISALVIATAPPAAAVAQRLAAGSVGTRELRNGAVTAAKMHTNAVRGSTVVDGSLTRYDLAASARPRMPRSVAASAPTGTPGESGATVLSLAVPAGSWTLLGKATVESSSYGFTECWLHDGGRLDGSRVSPTDVDITNFPMTLAARVTYATPRTVGLICWGLSAELHDVRLIASEVAP